MNNCNYCNREFSNKGSLASHEPYCKNNSNRIKKEISKKAGAKKGIVPWNKGLSTSEYTKNKISEALKGISKGISSSEDGEILRRRKISDTMKRNKNSGGIRKGSGRGIKGRYKGIWCDSTWELAWVIYHLDHNIKFERNYKGFSYQHEGKIHTYYPDFKTEDTYIEIKGRRSYFGLDKKNKSKIDSFPERISILYQSNMKDILNYVESTYGKNFKSLYEVGSNL